MKTAKLLIPIVLFAISATAQTKPATKAKQPAAKASATTKPATTTAAGSLPSDEFFNLFVLPHSNDAAPAGYGTTPANPILVGAYEADLGDQKKINDMLNRFLKTYVFADGTQPTFVERTTKMIDAVNYDIFKVVKTAGTDTISLYTDQYKSGLVYPIKGFKFYSKADFVNQLMPTIQRIRGYNVTADKYENAGAKALSISIVSSISRDLGLDYFMDKDYLGPLLNDTGVDLDLKAFLIRNYIFHKLEYEVTGQPAPKDKAFNAMLDDYQVAIKAHKIFAKGILPTLVKK